MQEPERAVSVARNAKGREWPEQLAVRIAWCYYELGLTQQEVAARLGITRVRVNRMLSEAKRRGLVRVSIASPLAENVELEERLKSRYGLTGARVVLGANEEDGLADYLGRIAAPTVAPLLTDGATIGIGWGATLRAMAEAMPELSLSQASVVALLGSLTRRSSIDAFEGATMLARRLQAECFYMPGPLICDSEESCRTLLSQPMMTDVRDRARAADVALVSVGGVDSSTIRRAGLVDEDEFESVRQAGAVGNFVGHYIDADAAVVDHPLNRRVLGLHPDALAAIPRRVMISGGPRKVRALQAILGRGLLTDLVTDQVTALALLGETKALPSSSSTLKGSTP